MYFEITTPAWEAMLKELRALPIVRGLDLVKSMQEIYGKRIIIMGGGAQVWQVAIPGISTSLESVLVRAFSWQLVQVKPSWAW